MEFNKVGTDITGNFEINKHLSYHYVPPPPQPPLQMLYKLKAGSTISIVSNKSSSYPNVVINFMFNGVNKPFRACCPFKLTFDLETLEV